MQQLTPTTFTTSHTGTARRDRRVLRAGALAACSALALAATAVDHAAFADFVRFDIEYSAAVAGKTPVVVSNLYGVFSNSTDRFGGMDGLWLVGGSPVFVHRDFESELSYSTVLGSWAPNGGPASSQVDSFLAAGNGPGASSTQIAPEGPWGPEGFVSAQPPLPFEGPAPGYYPVGIVSVGATNRILCGRFVAKLDSVAETPAHLLAGIRWQRAGENFTRRALASVALSDIGNDLCPDDPLKTRPGQCGCGTPESDSDSDGSADCWDEPLATPVVLRWPRYTKSGTEIPSVVGAIAAMPDLLAVGAPFASREVAQQGAVAIAEKSGDAWMATGYLFDPQGTQTSRTGSSIALARSIRGEQLVVAGSKQSNLANPIPQPIVVWSRSSTGDDFTIAARIAPIVEGSMPWVFGELVCVVANPGVGDDILVKSYERVFVFRRTPADSGWSLVQTITPPAASFETFFAKSLEVVGRTLLVGTTYGPFGSLTKTLLRYELDISSTVPLWTLRSEHQPPADAISSSSNFFGTTEGDGMITSFARSNYGVPVARLFRTLPPSEPGGADTTTELSQPRLRLDDALAGSATAIRPLRSGDLLASEASHADGLAFTLYRRADASAGGSNGTTEWIPFAGMRLGFGSNFGSNVLSAGGLLAVQGLPATDEFAANALVFTGVLPVDCDGDGATDDSPDSDGDGLSDCIDPDDDGDGIDDAFDPRGDLDGNGIVDQDDLAILFAHWGDPGFTDLSGDGTTDARDLALFLAAW